MKYIWSYEFMEKRLRLNHFYRPIYCNLKNIGNDNKNGKNRQCRRHWEVAAKFFYKVS